MFPITMSFTVSTPAELAKLVEATGTQISVDAPQGAKKPNPKPEKPAATQAAAAGQTANTENASASRSEGNAQPPAAASAAPPAATPATPEPTAAPSGGDATIDKAKALTMKIVADKGRDAAVELLKKYGVPVAAKLPADQVAAFCADAEAVLAS